MSNQTEQSPNFTFKIVNLKKDYKDELLETDFLRLKVGDYVEKKNQRNAWKVSKIYRDTINDATWNLWLKKATTSIHQDAENNRFRDLLHKYKKSLNFGACFVTIQPVIIDGNPVQYSNNRRKNSTFCELANTIYTGNQHSIYTSADMVGLLSQRDLNINSLKSQIIDLEKEIALEEKLKCSILSLFNIYKSPETVIEVGELEEVTAIPYSIRPYGDDTNTSIAIQNFSSHKLT